MRKFPPRSIPKTKQRAPTHLQPLIAANRAQHEVDRQLTDAQTAALQASCRKDGAVVRPATAPAGASGIHYATATLLVRRGLATMQCSLSGDGLVLDRHDEYRDGGTLHATLEGRAHLRLVMPEIAVALAPAGKLDADELGYYHDGRDPLNAGGHIAPDDPVIDPERARESKKKHQRAREWQRRKAA